MNKLKTRVDSPGRKKMRIMTRGIVALLLAFSVSAMAGDLKLWYDKPALRWEQEALPIGNGRLGAMIYGGVDHEHIQFNEDSLWIGDEKDTGAFQAFGDVFLDFGPDCEDGKVVLAECTSGQSSPQGTRFSRVVMKNKRRNGAWHTRGGQLCG